jgi:hypothetical protein
MENQIVMYSTGMYRYWTECGGIAITDPYSIITLYGLSEEEKAHATLQARVSFAEFCWITDIMDKERVTYKEAVILYHERKKHGRPQQTN